MRFINILWSRTDGFYILSFLYFCYFTNIYNLIKIMELYMLDCTIDNFFSQAFYINIIYILLSFVKRTILYNLNALNT